LDSFQGFKAFKKLPRQGTIPFLTREGFSHILVPFNFPNLGFGFSQTLGFPKGFGLNLFGAKGEVYSAF